MTLTFRESGLDFAFAPEWTEVVKWDDHPAFIDGLRRRQETAAVDFVGLLHGEAYFIEVKSFRGHRIENKARLTSGELAREVADKVRDTLAGIVWACGRQGVASGLHTILRPIFRDQVRRRVVLWLEEDPAPRPVDQSALAQRIRGHLRWLSPHVIVCDRTRPPAGITITGAPERG